MFKVGEEPEIKRDKNVSPGYKTPKWEVGIQTSSLRFESLRDHHNASNLHGIDEKTEAQNSVSMKWPTQKLSQV